MQRLLDANGHELINAKDADGMTWLIWAAQRGNDTCEWLLLTNVADAKISDADGWTPLMCSLSEHENDVILRTWS
jgi:ankyrin repeat protein